MQKAFLTDTKGNKSSMRLAFLHSVFAGVYGGVLLAGLDIVLNDGKNLVGVAAVISALELFAFGAKAYSGKHESNKPGE